MHDLASLRGFLAGRLHTAGLVAAGLTAAACRSAGRSPTPPAPMTWAELDAEADARTASPAQRRGQPAAGQAPAQGRRRVWPSPVLEELALAVPNPITPSRSARWRTRRECRRTRPPWRPPTTRWRELATAAVRLLGLDPVEVHRLLAGLAPDLDAVAERAAAAEVLPATSAPALDLLAERHARAGLRTLRLLGKDHHGAPTTRTTTTHPTVTARALRLGIGGPVGAARRPWWRRCAARSAPSCASAW
ncbi:hypothetical protein GCM10020219_081900 [Nonomuraea dietziae]